VQSHPFPIDDDNYDNDDDDDDDIVYNDNAFNHANMIMITMILR
jgi:hypothetical protein